MDIHLVVVKPFAAHVRGDRIEDAREVEAVLGGEHADKVVRVLAETAPAAPEPATDAPEEN